MALLTHTLKSAMILLLVPNLMKIILLDQKLEGDIHTQACRLFCNHLVIIISYGRKIN